MQSLEIPVEELIDRALAEDLSYGDATTETLIPDDQQRKALIMVKAEGVLAGIQIAEEVFHKVDPKLGVSILLRDGARVKPGNIVASVEGKVASILKAERTVLNFLQRLGGIASETANYVKAVEGLPVQITDTRKTTPGLRLLEKYAVRVGGGQNHRMHLGDGILIKDNHLAVLHKQGISFEQIIAKVRQNVSRSSKIEIEVKTPEEALEAAKARADIIMLDNMNLKDMKRAVQLINGRTLIEASGGMT